MDSKYFYLNDGEGVNIFIVDTGIYLDHYDYYGRATVMGDVFGEGGYDCHGHGTSAASLAAGTYSGVAKQANIIAYRVLNCDGYGYFTDLYKVIVYSTLRRLSYFFFRRFLRLLRSILLLA